MKKWVQFMNKMISNQTSQTTTNVLGFAVGAALADGGHLEGWPIQETSHYKVIAMESSYSLISDQVMMNTEKRNPNTDFVRGMASIYTSLSKRQKRLDKEFEAAIFDNLESLYET